MAENTVLVYTVIKVMVVVVVVVKFISMVIVSL